MNIVFHTHHADVTDAVRDRAEQHVRKLAARLRGTTDASVRFADDGTVRRVELVLRAARRRPLVVAGVGSRVELALADALDRLSARVAHARVERERRLRRVAPLATAVPVREPLDDLLLADLRPATSQPRAAQQ